MKHIALLLLLGLPAAAELPSIPVIQGSEAALDPAAPAWKTAPAARLALYRTPPIYSTDAPAALEITAVQVQVIHAGDKSVVRLEWKDATKDAAELPPAINAWQSQTKLERSEATDRFFDACAVMIPLDMPSQGGVYPSLQMGDAAHPVLIYYYDVTRGPALMQAAGRASTRRTGKKFAGRAVYANQSWLVTLELPALAPGTPLAVGVWNGSQQDRDGRKYFSLWHQTRSQQ